MKSFFSEDWSRLRALIMELEEEGWSEDTGADDGRTENSEHSPAADQPGEHDSNIPQIAAGTDTNRLQELAAQIEQRLQAASEGKE